MLLDIITLTISRREEIREYISLLHMGKNILIVEDEIRMRRLLSDYFRKENFNIVQAQDGEEALKLFYSEHVDLIILDIMLPNLDGFSVCKYIREKSDVPIIILTARSEEDDKLLGFELGADEYVTKPFSPKVLVARAKVLLRRADGTISKNNDIININGISINLLSMNVTVDKNEINLSPKEFDLLHYMIKNKGIVLSRNKLLNNVWGYDYYGDLRTVDTHIKRLREKLGKKADLITTVRGSGYKFEVQN